MRANTRTIAAMLLAIILAVLAIALGVPAAVDELTPYCSVGEPSSALVASVYGYGSLRACRAVARASGGYILNVPFLFGEDGQRHMCVGVFGRLRYYVAARNELTGRLVCQVLQEKAGG